MLGGASAGARSLWAALPDLRDLASTCVLLLLCHTLCTGAAASTTDKRLKVLTMQRDKGAEFILYKARVGKSEKTYVFAEEPELTDLGLHWGEDGTTQQLTQ